jgi:hypothetical protein
MKRFLAASAMAALPLAVAACTGSTGSARSADGPASYLASNKSQLAFIQWRINRGQVDGTLEADHIGGAAPAAALSVNSVPFTGTVHGTSVNLTFAHGLFLQSYAQGTLAGSTLTLAVPQADGSTQRTTFTRSSQTSYNRAAAALRSNAQAENMAATRADSSSSANGRADQRNTQADLAALYQASSLAPHGKLAQDVDRFASDAATARARLATEKQDATADNKYCAASSTVEGDSHGVDGAALSAMGDTQALTADASVIRMDTQTAYTDMRRLSRVGLPAPTSAPALIANAKASVAQAIASANSYIDQINASNNQARVLANHMATGKCASAGQAPVTAPVAHIK